MRPNRSDERPAIPSLVKGRGRDCGWWRAVFALAFCSIGLRLLDMVGWQASELTHAAVRQRRRRSRPVTPMRGQPRRHRRPQRRGARDQPARPGRRTPTRPSSSTRPRPPGGWRRSCPAWTPPSCSGGSRRARRFAWVKHRITPEEQQAVLELGLPGRRVQRRRASRLSRRSNLDQPRRRLRQHRRDRPGRHRALRAGAADAAAASRWR